MATDTDMALRQGVFIVGEFIKRETITRKSAKGDFERVAVKLLIDGEYPRTVEYPADRELPAIVAAAERGDVLTLPVFTRVSRDTVYWQGVTG